MQPGPLNPARLLPGTQVGSWRIVDWRGSGTYGAVYLARKAKPEATGFVALKLALNPRDKRFGREGELLYRLRHPAIPRLLARGQWQSAWGQSHPYLVMEWIEGLPLYEWARTRGPSSRQVLQVLAGLARALEATHSVGGVHRDVKGDNTLVRLKDGQAFLTDFGSATWRGADTLTDPVFPPGTPAYRSPEAFQFALNIRHEPIKTYAPGPADDLFALGVTAYHLVTGQYPPSPQPLDKEFHVWSPEGKGPRPARELNARCSPELSALISRMLSREPEARGSARELARALEKAARKAGPEAKAPLSPRGASSPEQAEAAPQRIHLRAPRWSWQPWLAVASVAGLGALGVSWLQSRPGREDAAQTHVAEQEEARDAGTVAVGDSVLTAAGTATSVPAEWSPIALDMPSKPLPGQLRPDTNGRCPRKSLVLINGGCWTKVAPKDCEESSYVYRGECYDPAFPPPRPATSSPAESRDGG